MHLDDVDSLCNIAGNSCALVMELPQSFAKPSIGVVDNLRREGNG